MDIDNKKSPARPSLYDRSVAPSATGPELPHPLPQGGEGTPYAAPTFDDLYTDHFRFVWRSLRRLGVAEPALDDASQEVFVAVHRHLHEYVPRSSPKAWLFAIARRVASDHRRKVRRKGGLAPLSDNAEASSSEGPHESAARNQAARVVHEFLEQLAPEQREVFILSELEQMTAPEIAEALAVNPNTVYTRVRTTRQALHAFVLRHYPGLMEDGRG